MDELKAAPKIEWESFPQKTINNAIDALPGRLRRAVELKGGHIESY